MNTLSDRKYRDIECRPIFKGKEKIGKVVTRYFDEDGWSAIAVINRVKGKSVSLLDWFFDAYNWGYYYSGPGRSFAVVPFIKRTRGHIYIRWHGGLDI